MQRFSADLYPKAAMSRFPLNSKLDRISKIFFIIFMCLSRERTGVSSVFLAVLL